MASRVTRVGNLDIQFQQNWEAAKGNQLVQSLQQTISAVNSAWGAIAALQASSGSGGVTAPVQIAGTTGIGPQVSVGPGLTAGQVLIAIAADNAAFAQLQFGQLAATDEASFAAAVQGDVIIFHNGFWTAMPDPSTGLGLADPGQNALVMWNEAGSQFAWAIPAAGGGIKLVTGAISVDASQLDHAKLQGLHFTVIDPSVVANDHPQYAMLAAANTWALAQTFNAGLISNANITLNGNLEQSGAEPEWRIVNTDDIANEGAWRIHAEPGQFIISSVSDDGADGENWLCATRIGETVDAVNVSANSFTYNGFDVLVANPMGAANPFLYVIAGGISYEIATAAAIPAPGTASQFVLAAGWNSASGAIPIASTVPQDVEIPYGCTLQEILIQTQPGTAGSCTITLGTQAFPLTAPVDITGGVPPAIAAATSYSNSTLTGYTTVFAQKAMIRATLTANSVFTSVKIFMRFK